MPLPPLPPLAPPPPTPSPPPAAINAASVAVPYPVPKLVLNISCYLSVAPTSCSVPNTHGTNYKTGSLGTCEPLGTASLKSIDEKPPSSFAGIGVFSINTYSRDMLKETRKPRPNRNSGGIVRRGGKLLARRSNPNPRKSANRMVESQIGYSLVVDNRGRIHSQLRGSEGPSLGPTTIS